MHGAFLFCRHRPDDRRLNDRHKRHIGVGRNDNRSEVSGVKIVGDKDGGRSVCRTDDADGSGILQAEAKEGRQTQREKNAELGCCTEQHHQRIGQKRRKVDHGSNADKEQEQKDLIGNSCIEEGIERPLCQYTIDCLRDCSRHRKIHQNCAESHWYQ